MSNTITPTAIKIPQQGYAELQQLSVHSARLREVVEIAGTSRLDVNPSKIRQSVANQINVTVEVAGALLSGLGSLRNIMQQAELTAEEVISRITLSLRKAPSWREKMPIWESSRGIIIAALDSIGVDHPLLLRQKALELTYTHQNIFKRSQIMTDLRPVFSSTGEEMLAMVLTHVLSIEYFDGVRMQRTEFALDEEDVENLRKATERAAIKTRASKRKFEASDLLLIVAGNTSKED